MSAAGIFDLILSVIRAIFGFFLAMFIPGYALSLVFYPDNKDLPIINRIALSPVFSIMSVILVVLFIDEVLAMKTTPENIIISLIIFTIAALLVWRAGIKINNIIINSNIISEGPIKIIKIFKNPKQNSGLLNNIKSKTKKREENHKINPDATKKQKDNDDFLKNNQYTDNDSYNFEELIISEKYLKKTGTEKNNKDYPEINQENITDNSENNPEKSNSGNETVKIKINSENSLFHNTDVHSDNDIKKVKADNSQDHIKGVKEDKKSEEKTNILFSEVKYDENLYL